MAVAPEVSRAVMKSEVAAALKVAAIYGWMLCPDYDALLLRVRMKAHTGDIFIAHVTFHNYREWPATYDFFDPASGQVGVKCAFPCGHDGDSFFNTTGPQICAPFNLKAYKRDENPSGLHQDWSIGDWENSTVQNFHWATHNTLAGGLSLIQNRLDRPDKYKGRMT